MKLNDVLKTSFVKALNKELARDEYVIVLERPASFVVKGAEEGEQKENVRHIILPPRGHTSNEANQTNCSAGVLTQKINFIGGVREGKTTFSKLRDSLMEVSFGEDTKVSRLDRPYVPFDPDDPGLPKKLHSANQPPFDLVNENGQGFYNTLFNLSDDWLVIQESTVGRPQRDADLAQFVDHLDDYETDLINELHDEISEKGDKLFARRPQLVDNVLEISPEKLLPILGEMLYIKDTGEHETCTAFAMILKVAKTHQEETLSYLESALKSDSIPKFFNEQLIEKVKKIGNPHEGLIDVPVFG